MSRFRSVLGCSSAVCLAACATPAAVVVPQTYTISQAPALSATQMDALVQAAMQRFELPGLSIAFIDDGAIVYERKLGLADTETDAPITPNSVFQVASLSKPVFAYLVMRMADRGVIDLDRPLWEYRPMAGLVHEPNYKQITARMVLSHRTGFPNWRWFDPIPEGRDIQRGSMYMKTEPGTFSYSGEGYNWLAEIVAQETGRSLLTLDELFQQEMVAPLNLDNAAFVQTPYIEANAVTGHIDGKPNYREWPRSFPEDTPQTFGAAGRLHTDAAIYARFLVALMDGIGLSQEAQRAMFSKATDIPVDDNMRKTSGEIGWTLGLSIKQGASGQYFAHGGSNGDFKSGFAIDPERGDGFVFVTNSDRGDELNAWLEDRFFP